MRRFLLLIVLAVGCAEPTTDDDTTVTPATASIEGTRQIVPSDGLPNDLDIQTANNNLDVVQHDGRVWLAWRTAPSHFASDQAEMHVVSSEDEVTWRWEGTFSLGRDLREPQLVPADDGLWLYMAKLGTNTLDFEPGGVVRAKYIAAGDWTEPADFGPEGFIAWRVKQMDGLWWMFGYVGGESVYDPEGDPIELHVYTSEDGTDWEGAFGDPVVLEGGGSESDAVFLDDGTMVAVVRNEKGDDDGFGSKICTGPPESPGVWTCASDDKKYDSPMMFSVGGQPFLVGRRNVTETGAYDVADPEAAFGARYLENQGAYWQEPKRCALWAVDAETRSTRFLADLPSKGDTCFPEGFELVRTRIGATWAFYNYSSDPQGPERSWIEGQTAPTQIYRTEVDVRIAYEGDVGDLLFQ